MKQEMAQERQQEMSKEWLVRIFNKDQNFQRRIN